MPAEASELTTTARMGGFRPRRVQSGHAAMPADRWIPAIPLAELGPTPAGVVLEGVPIVIFRDAAGAPRALLDRCPHRWVPLSMGACERGRIVCAYHGWAFDGAGACVRIPSNLAPEGPPLPRPMAMAYEVEVRDGRVWVRLDAAGTPP